MNDDADDLCVLHHWQFDDECELCKADVERLQGVRKQRKSASARLLADIAQMGGAVDPSMQLYIRVDMILQLLMTVKQRHKFEGDFLQVWGNQLIEAKQQLMKDSLTSGIYGPNGVPFDPKRAR